MNIQDKKNYLKQYKRAKAKLLVLERELDDLRINQLPSGIDYSKDKIQTSSSNDQMVNYVARLEELEINILKLKSEAINTCTEILNTISSLDNDMYQTVLHRKYILLQTWEDIAEDMGYSIQWVYLTHGEALGEINIPNKKIREN